MKAIRSALRDFVCIDCGVDTLVGQEYYMVIDALWRAARMKPNGGMLCVGCLEKRIGRKLEHGDFTNALVNSEFLFPKSRRLKARIRG